MTELPVINHCGTCTACCTLLGVPTLKKGNYIKCQHECETGCAIYDSRPAECKGYECYWLKHPDNENYRPDKLGVIVEVQASHLGPAVVVREIYEGAFNQPAVQEYIRPLCEQYQAFVYLTFEQKRRALFPKWAMEAAKKASEMGQYFDLLLFGQLKEPE